MSTVQEIESAISNLSPAEMRQVRDWLDNLIEDRFTVREDFAAKIELSEKEMSSGLKPRTRQP
jgi:hypothetical protein